MVMVMGRPTDEVEVRLGFVEESEGFGVDALRLLYHDTGAGKGFSGAPLIDMYGTVIGVIGWGEERRDGDRYLVEVRRSDRGDGGVVVEVSVRGGSLVTACIGSWTWPSMRTAVGSGTGNADQNLAVVRHMAVNMLKQETTAKVGIKAKRKKAGWDYDYLLKVLST